MKTVALRNLGRLGNLLFRYAYARALCERNGYELRTEPWIGEQIFTLDGHRAARPTGHEDIVIDEYRQAQNDLIYTRADCRRWFRLKPEMEDFLRHIQPLMPHVHLRRGDYWSAGYPIISYRSAERAMAQYGIEEAYVAVSDDNPGRDLQFTGSLSMIPDFIRLMRAPILFRANSSFSYWAAVLGNGRVFSPIITGLTGGEEHDNVPYVEGNWPRLCELEFVTDLHLSET